MKDVYKRQVEAFLLPAFCTNSNILVTVDSANSLVTFTLITPDKFIVPERISSVSYTHLSAISGPTWAVSPSIACLPAKTIS